MSDFSKQLQMLRSTGMLPRGQSVAEEKATIENLINIMMTFGWTVNDLRETPLPTIREINAFFKQQSGPTKKGKNKMPSVPNIRSLNQMRF